MNFGLECKKLKRTGLTPAFLCEGILAAAVPILNMSVRPQRYLGLDASPVRILMDANWQIMAMLNILLVMAGACLMYQTEYADGAMQRMRTLPLKESRLFFGKLALTVVICIAILAIEAAGTAFCAYYWFKMPEGIPIELLKSFGYALLLMLPAASCSLLIASLSKNMWVSLGIGVVCVFTATMLPTDSFALSLFPFALPFQIFGGAIIHNYIIAAVTEFFIIGIAEILYLKVRRLFE